MTRVAIVIFLLGGVAPAAAQAGFPGGGAGGYGGGGAAPGYSANPGMTLPTAPGAEPVPGNYYYPTTPQKSPQANISPNDDDGPSLRNETKKETYSRYLNVPQQAPRR